MTQNLPGVLQVPTRAQKMAEILRLMKLRAPQAVEIGDGTQANYDAAVLTDLILPVLGECARKSASDMLDGKSGSDLDTLLSDLGLPARAPAVGSSGFVSITTSAGGAQIQGDDGKPGTGDQLVHPQLKFIFEAVSSQLYTSAIPVAIVGVTTGPQTNLPAGTILQWVSPRNGLSLNATVLPAPGNTSFTSGPGLIDGALAESDEQVRQRIRNSRRYPAAAGNDAAYVQAAQGTPAIAIAQAFTYPAWNGPGSSAIALLLVPAQTGATRIPSNAQIALVQAQIPGQMPRDDSVAYLVVTPQNQALTITVRWVKSVASWYDNTPWPPNDGNVYSVSNAVNPPTPTTFAIAATGSPTTPQVGQNIAFFDKTNQKFWNKRILTVTGGNPWTIVVDQSNNASDTTFAPVVGALVSPWSTSLGTLVLPVLSYFDGLGPGEMFSTFFDNGFRQKRFPPDPELYGASVTSEVLAQLLALPGVNNVTVVSPSLPLAPTVGSPGVSVNLIVLSDFQALPG